MFTRNVLRICFWLYFLLIGLRSYLYKYEMHELGYILYALPLVIAIIIAVLNLKEIRISKRFNSLDFWFFGLFFIEIVSVMRSFTNGEIVLVQLLSYLFSYVLSILFFFFYFKHVFKFKSNLLWKDLSISIIVLLTVNVFSKYILNISSPEEEILLVKSLETNLGLTSTRIYLPFVSTLRVTSQLVGVLIICFFYKIGQRRNFPSKFIYLVYVFLMMLLIALLDSRMVLAVSLLSLLVFTFVHYFKFNRWFFRTSPKFIFALLCFPFIWLALYYQIFMDWGGDFTINNRIVFWGTAMLQSLNLSATTHLFGSGMHSHNFLGFTDIYGHIMAGGWKNIERIHLHNTTLQRYFDSGLIGLIVYFGYFRSLLRRIQLDYLRIPELDKLIVVLLVVYLFLISATEITLPAYSETLIVLYLLPYFSVSAGQNKEINNIYEK